MCTAFSESIINQFAMITLAVNFDSSCMMLHIVASKNKLLCLLEHDLLYSACVGNRKCS